MPKRSEPGLACLNIVCLVDGRWHDAHQKYMRPSAPNPLRYQWSRRRRVQAMLARCIIGLLALMVLALLAVVMGRA
jgi:hypothetical protein